MDGISTRLRGGAAPRHVALALVLGAAAGVACGWNLTAASLLLLALALNVSLRVWLQGFVLGIAAGWLLTPAFTRLGQRLLDETALGAWLAGRAPLWTALFDLEHYALVGGVAATLLVSIPVALAAALAARRLQRQLEQDFLRTEPVARPRWPLLRRAVCFLLYGRPSLVAVAVCTRSRPHVKKLLLALVLAGGGALTAAWAAPDWLGQRLLEHLAEANGAAVEAASCRWDFSRAMVELCDVALVHPANPQIDRLRIAHATAQIDLGALLRGVVRIDHLLLENLSTDHPRSRPAPRRSLAWRASPAAPLSVATAESSSNSDLIAIDAPWQQRFASLAELVAFLERSTTPSTEAMTGGPVRRGLPAAPAWSVREVRVEGLPDSWGLGAAAALEATACGMHLDTAVARLSVALPRFNSRFQVELAPATPAGVRSHVVRWQADNLPLADLTFAPALAGTTIRSGQVRCQGVGTLTSQGIDLPLEVHVEPLQIDVAEGTTISGVSTALWTEALTKLRALKLSVALRGPWQHVQLHSTNPLADILAANLECAGDLILAQTIAGKLPASEPLAATIAPPATLPLEEPPLEAAPVEALPAEETTAGGVEARFVETNAVTLSVRTPSRRAEAAAAQPYPTTSDWRNKWNKHHETPSERTPDTDETSADDETTAALPVVAETTRDPAANPLQLVVRQEGALQYPRGMLPRGGTAPSALETRSTTASIPEVTVPKTRTESKQPINNPFTAHDEAAHAVAAQNGDADFDTPPPIVKAPTPGSISKPRGMEIGYDTQSPANDTEVTSDLPSGDNADSPEKGASGSRWQSFTSKFGRGQPGQGAPPSTATAPKSTAPAGPTNWSILKAFKGQGNASQAPQRSPPPRSANGKPWYKFWR